jgi:hypothetical protein
MNENIQTKIKQYFIDEDSLYQDWEKEFGLSNDNDPDHMLVSSDDPTRGKQRWASWYADKKQFINESLCTKPFIGKETFCQRWQHLHKKGQFQNKEELILALFIDATSIHIYHSVTLISILVIKGILDELCDCEDCL